MSIEGEKVQQYRTGSSRGSYSSVVPGRRLLIARGNKSASVAVASVRYQRLKFEPQTTMSRLFYFQVLLLKILSCHFERTCVQLFQFRYDCAKAPAGVPQTNVKIGSFHRTVKFPKTTKVDNANGLLWKGLISKNDQSEVQIQDTFPSV